MCALFENGGLELDGTGRSYPAETWDVSMCVGSVDMWIGKQFRVMPSIYRGNLIDRRRGKRAWERERERARERARERLKLNRSKMIC
jgi:hypothetical protein